MLFVFVFVLVGMLVLVLVLVGLLVLVLVGLLVLVLVGLLVLVGVFAVGVGLGAATGSRAVAAIMIRRGSHIRPVIGIRGFGNPRLPPR
ncbi:hypothetical protein BMJ22_15625 [Sinorhizobium medicae]|nr:hypothetical protein BMJ22_15625 [Sinorhizobium medicae]